MSENLDNLLVEAFSKGLFRDDNEVAEKEEGVDKEDGEVVSDEDNEVKHKSKSKHKSRHSLKTLKTKARNESKSQSKSKSKKKSELKSKVRSKVKSKVKSKIRSSLKSKSKSMIDSKTKRLKSSDKSDESKDKRKDDIKGDNDSEVMKLLLSKQLRSYAQIEFKDDPKDTTDEMPKKSSKHKSSKSDERHRKRHKRYKSNEEYEPQNDLYYWTKSGAEHEDYFYGSYYEGMEQRSNSSRRTHYSRPLSPLYDPEWRYRSRSQSPNSYDDRQRRRSMSPIERNSRQRSYTPFYKDRYCKHSERSRRSLSPTNSMRSSVDRIDKQKLLEIARNNLIKMIETGDLPKGTDITRLKLRHLRELTTQKSVQQWTEFCRAISALETTADSDSDLNSDYDSDNSDLRSVASEQHIFSIRHPFKLKERKDIEIRVRDFNQLPIRSSQQMGKQLREQFPVSSGSQHRHKEIDWREVVEPMLPPIGVPKKGKRIDTKLSSILKPTPVPPPSDEDMKAFTIKPMTDTNPPKTTTITSTTTESEAICETIPTETTNESELVFPQSLMPIDIGSVMAQRLNAMRKLEEEPHNVVALKQMYQANQMMTEWAESKIVPGQFIGSTGANVLTPNQLEGPVNAWTRKDQLKTAAPITEGIGMSLLLKMGWSPGQGLGKDQNGIVDPIMLDIKMDKKGLVAENEEVRNLPLQLVSTKSDKMLGKADKNPVSILHELSSKKRFTAPEYELVSVDGPQHRLSFTFKVVFNGVEYQPSISSANKKQAKALAAGVCLQALGLLPKDNT